MSGLDDLLEGLLPGAGGARGAPPLDAPLFPAGLELVRPELLGRGAVGWVYRAHDPVLGCDVAVKIARPERGAEAREALLREARRTAKVRHPASLAVMGLEVHGGLMCLRMQLAPSLSLAELLARWRARPEEAWPVEARLNLLVPLVEVMVHAGRQGVVHGDLHPGHVMVDDGHQPLVVDWGGHPGGEGVFHGTPEYASPEQLQGEAPTQADDVYALAAVVWEVMSLRRLRPDRPAEALGPWLAQVAAEVLPDLSVLVDLDEGLAEVVRGCLGPREGRPAGAALGRVLQGVRSGRSDRARREEEARRALKEAQELLLRFHERERRVVEERRVMMVQRLKVPAWAPPRDKRSLWATEGRLMELLNAQGETWTQAIEAAVRATTLAPTADEAHALLAELWWERLRMAEERGYVAEAALARRRIQHHDRGRYAPLLERPGLLSVVCEGRVRVERVLERGPLWGREEVGWYEAPVRRLELPPGSYVLTVVQGAGAQTVPVQLERMAHHEEALSCWEAAPEGWVWVPGGPFRMGGDEQAAQSLDPCRPVVDRFMIQELPVSHGAYLRFLESLAPAEALRRAPAVRAVFGRTTPLWEGEPGGWVLPEGCGVEQAVVGVSLDDAWAYAAWWSKIHGRQAVLPTEEAWEKAARGVDGRPWPWGAHFDPSFCHTRESLEGAPRPADRGSFAADRSVYGVLDCAGGVREWTTSAYPGGRVVVRGGSWADDARDSRLASRAGVVPEERSAVVGFRLMCWA